ncbi:alpha/beta hydrolase [Candidatus Spongiihabitans sp.]|uniref:alpha/beta hydrolase n=1 Tax=Candidatus Spongiihabitans sp. TaxID=3101308 RepID=UPI003C7D2AAB
MSRAVTAAKRSVGDRITLVGYSGGGVIVALLASRRSDVDRLITIAAPLDTKTWAEYHGVSPLQASLNPLASVSATGSVREFHFHGGRDQTVPPEAIKRYIRQAAREGVRFFMITEYDHGCCWVRDWPTLLAMTDARGRSSRSPVGVKPPRLSIDAVKQ